ncbi:MAG: exodeoxyribonuclease VII large subunit [Phycisphaerales bacterium]|nr:exodeoxyribonuclease VII large subunit [Phycisphaerales bacterium]
MERPLFDPAKMKQKQAVEAAGTSAPPPVLTVSQLAGRIDVALRAALPAGLRVIGEVSGFRDRTHWYFDLKDADSVVSCVMFQGAARKSGLALENGLEVVLTGRIDFYAKQGKVSFIVDRAEPVGAGALDLAFKKLCEELRALGWFSPERKRPLPVFPRRIAVITSRSAAALQDVLVTMRKRCPAVEVLLVDVRVQGEGAAAEVAGAIRELSRRAADLRVDAVLVTRGGGSKEDLWTFNERIVAEAIVNCAVPVVAAIGHETDTTIAELVADERCATPTQAAMRLTPDGAALARQLEALRGQLAHALRRGLREQKEGLAQARRHFMQAIQIRRQRAASAIDRLAARLERHRPAAIQARRAERLEAVMQRLETAMARRLGAVDLDAEASAMERAMARAVEAARLRIDGLERQLQAVGPASVLERGFSYTTREDGRLIRSTGEVSIGDRIVTRLSDGQFRSVVGDGEPSPTMPAEQPKAVQGPASPTKARPKRRSKLEDGPGLF